jgi:hypothetical protein
MVKKPFTTRVDEEVLAVAQRLADAERRSVTSLIEVAVLEYAARHGVPSQDEIPIQSVSPQDGAVTDGSRIKTPRAKRSGGPKLPASSGRATRGGPRSR